MYPPHLSRLELLFILPAALQGPSTHTATMSLPSGSTTSQDTPLDESDLHIASSGRYTAARNQAVGIPHIAKLISQGLSNGDRKSADEACLTKDSSNSILSLTHLGYPLPNACNGKGCLALSKALERMQTGLVDKADNVGCAGFPLDLS